MSYLVDPLNEAQQERLEFLLNDWKHNISPDDLDTQKITIEDIVNKMTRGVKDE